MKSINLKSFLIGFFFCSTLLLLTGVNSPFDPSEGVGRYQISTDSSHGNDAFVIDTKTGAVVKVEIIPALRNLNMNYITSQSVQSCLN